MPCAVMPAAQLVPVHATSAANPAQRKSFERENAGICAEPHDTRNAFATAEFFEFQGMSTLPRDEHLDGCAGYCAPSAHAHGAMG